MSPPPRATPFSSISSSSKSEATMSEGYKQKLWVDCDAGIDDGIGLLMALSNPSSTILAVSSVYGNAGVCASICEIFHSCSVQYSFLSSFPHAPLPQFAQTCYNLMLQTRHRLLAMWGACWP